jgi:hypothetical protein
MPRRKNQNRGDFIHHSRDFAVNRVSTCRKP